MKIRAFFFIIMAVICSFACSNNAPTSNTPSTPAHVDTLERQTARPSEATALELRPSMSQTTWDSLHNWELGLALITPIYKAIGDDLTKDSSVYAAMNEPQKVFYDFWQMDNLVAEEGYVALFKYDLQNKIPKMITALEAIDEPQAADHLKKIQADYEQHKAKFADKSKLKNLAKELKWFDKYSSKYLDQHEKSIQKMEKYIRKNTTAFVQIQ